MLHMLRRWRERRFALRCEGHATSTTAVLVMIEFHGQGAHLAMNSSTRLASSLACGESGACSHTHSCDSHAHIAPFARFLPSCGLRAALPEADGVYKSDVAHAEAVPARPIAGVWDAAGSEPSLVSGSRCGAASFAAARQRPPHRPAAAAHELRMAPERLILFAVYSSLTSLREITGRLSYGRPEGVNSI